MVTAASGRPILAAVAGPPTNFSEDPNFLRLCARIQPAAKAPENLFINSSGECKTRRKSVKKRSLHEVNEHFESIFDAPMDHRCRAA
jgi:hypothetical protein